MNQQVCRHNYQIGTQVVSERDGVLGTLSDYFAENGRVWGVIGDDFEVDLTGSAMVLDLTGHGRLANPRLAASYLRLAH